MSNKVNTLVGSGYFSMRDVYGDSVGVSTVEETAPEPSEQQALANEENPAPNPKANSVGIITWLGIIVLFIVLMQIGGAK